MTEQAFCPHCGVPQIAGAQFCVKCGQKLPGGPPVQQTAPVAPSAAPSAAVTPPSWSQPPAAPSAAPAAAVTPPAWSQPPAAPPAPSAAVTPPSWSQQRGVTQPGPYGAPPPPPGYYPGGQPHPLVQRPTGIAILAILEVVGGVLCLLVAKALFDYADAVNRVNDYYGTAGDAGGAQFAGVAYLAASVASFVAAWGLWSIRPWAWLLGCALAAISVASAVLSLANHGDAVWVVINIGVNAGALYYLNINEIRALFGRPPSTFMQTRL